MNILASDKVAEWSWLAKGICSQNIIIQCPYVTLEFKLHPNLLIQNFNQLNVGGGFDGFKLRAIPCLITKPKGLICACEGDSFVDISSNSWRYTYILIILFINIF